MSAAIDRTDLGGCVWTFQTPLWQTNSLLAVAAGDALLCDPAFTPAEIDVIAAEARRRARGEVFLLVTHADYDHVCGIPYLPEATILAGAGTAAKIGDGSASAGLVSGGAEWGVSWPTELRFDRVLDAGVEVDCGAFRVAAIDAPSHGREGLGYVLRDQGVLLAGDNLSAISYPLLAGPLGRAIEATATLLEALDDDGLRHVVPGHGRVLLPDEARRIGREDLAYLERLQEAAREAADAVLSPGRALVYAYAVEPPRPTTLDFDIYDVRGGNARRALADAGVTV
jgi:glyoxylase-like metal-dependent hydrolase (beta-lactamase superfamily II)